MRDINRLDNFYNELKRIHKYVPDWRFGQFIINFLGWYFSKYNTDCFYVEDKEILKYIEKFIDDVREAL